MSSSISWTVAFLIIPKISSSSRCSKSFNERLPIHCIHPCMLFARGEQQRPIPYTMSNLSLGSRSEIRFTLIQASSTNDFDSSDNSIYVLHTHIFRVATHHLPPLITPRTHLQ